MCRQVPGLDRKANADVAADLSDPDGLTAISQWGEPQPQMKPLADRFANLLQGKILAPSKQVERTDGGIAVFFPQQERFRGFPARVQADHFGLVPASGKCIQQSFKLTNHDEIDRIARSGIPLVVCHDRKLTQIFHEGLNITVVHRIGGDECVELSMQVVGIDPRDGNGKHHVDKNMRF